MIKWLIHLLGGYTKEEYETKISAAYLDGHDDIWIV